MKNAIILLIIVILFTAGCTQINSLPGLPTKSEQPLIATSQSVTIEVKTPRTDEPVNGNYEFSPIIEVYDSGNADSEGVVCISGMSPETFRGFEGCECQDFRIYAKEDDGELSQEVQFGPYKVLAEAPKDELMTVTTRYIYETRAVAKACIKKDPYSKTGCQIMNLANQRKNILTSSTSGAVKIVKVTENIVPEDRDTVTLVFNVDVEKASTGNLYDESKADYPTCRSEEKQSKRISGEISGLPQGNIQCKEAELNEKNVGTLECEASGIRLIDSRGNTLTEDYEPEISIKINYGYEQVDTIKFSVTPSTR